MLKMACIWHIVERCAGTVLLCASRLDCHASDAGAVSCSYPRWDLHPVWLFSAGIVFPCEDLRYAHIIRERPGSWHRRKGLEPSSGGFGDRCSAIKLRLHMSPMDGFEPPRLVGTYCPPALPLSYIGVSRFYGPGNRFWSQIPESNWHIQIGSLSVCH